jgi:glycosyltransferase involved in cell wall biosynthesis
MIMTTKTLLQVRQNYPGLMITCNTYLDAFDDRDYKKIVVFLTGSTDREIAAQVPAHEVIFLELTKRQLEGFRLAAVRKLLQISRQNDVDLVFAHRYKSTYVMALAALFYQPRLMFSIIHGFAQLKPFSRRLLAHMLFRRKFKFIAVSEAIRQDILTSHIGVSPADVLALPNCIDMEKTRRGLLSRDEARRVLAISDNAFVIGHVGQLSPRKDQITLLRAFAQSKSHIPSAKLVIVGSGPLDQHLKAEANRLALADSVIFTGPVPNAYRVMPAFDLFALTSVSEAFGRVLLEAMVSKLPIIATDSAGVREVVGDLINLCPCGDIETLAKTFITHYEMNEIDKVALTEKAIHYVEANFSTAAFRKKLLEFVRSNTAPMI